MMVDQRHRGSAALRVRAGLVALLTLLGSTIGLGCSAATTHEWLVFFFDGVPEFGLAVEADFIGPMPARTSWAEVNARNVRRPQFNQHQPYAAHDCNACHVERPKGRRGILSIEAMSALNAPIDEMCARCHQPPRDEFVHAPVASGACLQCHHHHQSLQPALLLEESQEALCTACHTSDTWPSRQRHEEYATHDCGACHDPHASDNPSFLRPDWRDHEIAPFGPAPAPSPTPPTPPASPLSLARR